MPKINALLAITVLAAPAHSQNMTPQVNEPIAAILSKPVPVTAGDIIDRPYVIVGSVSTLVRKLTIFDAAPSEDKVFRELWERASRMKADAVIHAQYGAPEHSIGEIGARRADGVAIRFLSEAELGRRRN